MNQPDGVDGLEPRKKLGSDLSRATEVQRPSLRYELGQRRAIDKLHRHHLVAVLHNQIEYPAHVRRDDLTRRANFMPQELSGALVSDQIGRRALSATSTRSFKSKACHTCP